MSIDIQVREADLYFIAPLRIINYSSFEAGLLKAGWVRPSEFPFDLYSKDAIYDSAASFLGMTGKEKVSRVTPGACFVAPAKNDSATVVGRFKESFSGGNCELSFSNRKHKEEESPVWADEIVLGEILRVHVSPDRSTGLFVIHFRRPQFKGKSRIPPISIRSIESTNYWLHKTDDQAPTVFVNGTTVAGCNTIVDYANLLCGLAPGIAETLYPGRLLTATYMQIVRPESYSDGDAASFDREVDTRIMHISQCKGAAYEIVGTETLRTHHLFDNIRVGVSSEGFCGGFIVEKGADNERYMSKSSTTFLKSYLPVFLESVMLDLMTLRMLEGKDVVNLKGQDSLFQNLTLGMHMPVSRYTHLQQLKKIMLSVFSVPEKIRTVASYLDDMRKQEEQRNSDRINLLLGFMGVGQVIFAILQIIGLERVFGEGLPASPWMKAASIACVAVFFFFSLVIVVRVLPSLWRRRK